MDRRRLSRKLLSLYGDPADPRGMVALAQEYLESMRVRAFSERTVETRHKALAYFIEWCAQREIRRPLEVHKPLLERYQRHLFHQRKANGEPLSFRTQHGRLATLRGWFRYLARQNHILSNPASELELPRIEKRLPRQVLTASEVEQLLDSAELSDPLGLRDRAILETFYSTGMRRMELAALALYDVEMELGTVQIRQGKGKRDRIIPIGERALAWIDRYLIEVRPQLVWDPSERALFLTNEGRPFGLQRLTNLVRDYLLAAGIEKSGACHLLRHTMATLMLEGGADVRFVQQMLGHAKLETTEIYTHVSIRQLKAVHSATHPAARLERPSQRAED
jgi:integrase/recombinase XerD